MGTENETIESRLSWVKIELAGLMCGNHKEKVEDIENRINDAIKELIRRENRIKEYKLAVSVAQNHFKDLDINKDK